MATTTMGTKFPKTLVTELFNKVKGHSTLAKLSPQIPVAFTGTDIFTFSMDNDISIVGEGGTKPAGDVTATPVTIKPLKVVYQARVTDEFMTASEEAKLDILKGFSEGCAVKIGVGLDKMGFHGIDPKTGIVSSLIPNYFDKNVTNTTEYDSADGANEAVEAGIESLGEYQPTGIAISPAFAKLLAKESDKTKGDEFSALKWGGNPETLMGLASDVNTTVATAVKATSSAEAKTLDHAIVGDFNAFRWGFAKELPLEVIEFGNPDGAAEGDLKACNQVLLRTEAYIGFAVLDKNAFARIIPASQ